MTRVEFSKRSYHLIEDMNGWLRENIGKGGWIQTPDSRWYIESAFGNFSYVFNDARNATLFSLRWK